VVLLYYQNNHFTCSNRGLSSEVWPDWFASISLCCAAAVLWAE